MNLGEPTSYLALRGGSEVFSSDGVRVGTVRTVIADEADDIFEGVVIGASEGSRGERFVDAELISSIFEQGVELSIEAAAISDLPAPADNKLAKEFGSKDIGSSHRPSVFRRAWKRITGNY